MDDVSVTAATPAEPGQAVDRDLVNADRPHRGVAAAERARSGRAETLRLMQAGKTGDAKPSVPKPAPAQAKAETPAAAVDDAGAADEPGDEPAVDTAPAPAAKREPAPDPDTARRLSQLQAAEKRAKDAKAAARAEIEGRAKAIETEWSPRIAKAERFEALQAQAKKGGVHLVAALRELGIDDDGLAPAAQAIYAHSKEGAADPARRAAADRALREREEASRVDATQKRIDELERKLEARDQQATFAEQKAWFLDTAVEAITPDMPIAAKAQAAIEQARAEATPAGKQRAQQLATKLRTKLWSITEEMTNENDGEVPDFADVIARYEQIRGEELDELGIPRPTTTTTKPTNKPADKQPPARTLSNDLSTTRVPRPTPSGEDKSKAHRKESLEMFKARKPA